MPTGSSRTVWTSKRCLIRLGSSSISRGMSALRFSIARLSIARSRRARSSRGPSWPGWTPALHKLRLPGGDAWVRVTTDAEVFDDHAESHEFLSPGGPLFEALAAPTPEGASASGAAAGHCWLVEAGGDGGACEMLVLTPEGARRVDSLGDLLERLDRLPDREGFDGPRHPEGSCVRRLA